MDGDIETSTEQSKAYEQICTADFRGKSQPINVADVNLYEMVH